MWKVPKIVSETSSIVSQQDINILNIDAQEETSRILILVENNSVEEVSKIDPFKRHNYKLTKFNKVKPIMFEGKKIWIDGKLIDYDKAQIHVLTHGLHYGTGSI